ncbi:hypothetical protein [Paenibacillus sp. IITD108]|uniref:hypothetical protein n=1 Tax=Paenibacillus sp. IITD108 TaxID=3116649 RepID=UPI002F425B82
MVRKLVRFSLKKDGVAFSEKQKRDIQMHVNYDRNWRNFKALISIEIVLIDDTSFVVSVEEEGDSWHSNFARLLNEKAMLENLCVVLPNDRQLFNVDEELLG